MPATGMSRTKSIVYIALCIAVMAVSAWVTIPLGPVPFTLQMFALTFAIVVLSPRECLCAVAGYLLLGAVGVPVFSGMQGGLGKLMGPTGGFLWGYLFGAAAGVALLYAVRRRRAARDGGARGAVGAAETQPARGGKAVAFVRAFGWEVLAGLLFTAIAYVCGTLQFMVVMGATLPEALASCVAPFVAVDVCKVVAAVVAARAVRTATGR